MEREHIKIYTRAWRDDAPLYLDDPSPPTATLQCRVFIDGKELGGAISATVKMSSEFNTVTIVTCPAQVEIIALREDEWAALGK